jgi:hypothetical protein
MENSEKNSKASDVRQGSSDTPYVLPQPEQPFQGIIGKTYKDSTPHKLDIVKAPAGAPNVLYILIDDAGYGQWGMFGGQIPTPNLDRLRDTAFQLSNQFLTSEDGGSTVFPRCEHSERGERWAGRVST